MHRRYIERLMQLREMLRLLPNAEPVIGVRKNGKFHDPIAGPLGWALYLFHGSIKRKQTDETWEPAIREFFHLSKDAYDVLFGEMSPELPINQAHDIEMYCRLHGLEKIRQKINVEPHVDQGRYEFFIFPGPSGTIMPALERDDELMMKNRDKRDCVLRGYAEDRRTR